MPRIARLVVKGEPAVYHVISRTALDGFVLGDIEKDFLLKLIKRLSSVYFSEVLGFCVMGNPFTSLFECIREKIIQRKISRNGLLCTMAKTVQRCSRMDRFRYRTRYFTDSGIIGSKEFVSGMYKQFKGYFASKHKKKPRAVQGLEGIFSLKRLSENI